MNKESMTINELLSLSSNVKTKSKSYDPRLIRHRRNRWVYKVGDYLVRLFVPKISYAVKKTLSPAELKNRTKIKDRNVYVSCTCGFWKWSGPDYNAFDNDYSERAHSDLTPPDVRDPDRENYLCKHSYAALKKFRRDVKFAE